MCVRRAPLLVPACAALLAIVAEQHAWGYAAFAAVTLACMVAYFSCGRGRNERAVVVAIAVAFGAGVAVSVVRGHPATLTSERPTTRYTATVTGDVRDGDEGTASTILDLDGVGVVRATLREHIVPGERVLVRGRLEPFDEPRNPGEPSMREIERDDGFV